MINFWKLSYETVKKQRDQYEEENKQLREQFDYMNQSYMKLYEENEKLKIHEDNLISTIKLKDELIKESGEKINQLIERLK